MAGLPEWDTSARAFRGELGSLLVRVFRAVRRVGQRAQGRRRPGATVGGREDGAERPGPRLGARRRLRLVGARLGRAAFAAPVNKWSLHYFGAPAFPDAFPRGTIRFKSWRATAATQRVVMIVHLRSTGGSGPERDQNRLDSREAPANRKRYIFTNGCRHFSQNGPAFVPLQPANPGNDDHKIRTDRD